MTIVNSQSDRFIGACREHVDRVLSRCEDRTDSAGPLLADDGYSSSDDVAPRRTGVGRPMLLSNLADQQDFLRVLVGLSAVGGDRSYHDRALSICRTALQDHRHRGMLLWGNHACVDLLTKQPLYLAKKGRVHELKCHYPFYELLWEADARACEDMITRYWNGHMYDWSILDLSRHGRFDIAHPLPPEGAWQAPYVGGAPFFIGGGLTFINAGSDLYYAGALLSHFGGHVEPLTWAHRLLDRYTRTRHPVTGMGGYQYSCLFDKHDPEHRRNADRAHVQFGSQFAQHAPLEGRLSTPSRICSIIGRSALARFQLADTMGGSGTAFAQTAVEDLEAYGRWSYEFETNHIHPLFTDGTRITGIAMERDGYYGKAGVRFRSLPAGDLLFRAFVRGWQVSKTESLWAIARNIGQHLGVGDIGATPGQRPDVSAAGCTASVQLGFALLDLERSMPGRGYMDAADGIGTVLLRCLQQEDGDPQRDDDASRSMDRAEPLFLLHLAARHTGMPDAVPAYTTSHARAPLTGWFHEEDCT